MTPLSMTPGESARQFAAAQAAAVRRALSAEEPVDNAKAKPASAASPQPTVDLGVNETAGAKSPGAFFPGAYTIPFVPRLIAALHAPCERNWESALAVDSREVIFRSSTVAA